jgi:small subunit ribosomal protein S2
LFIEYVTRLGGTQKATVITQKDKIMNIDLKEMLKAGIHFGHKTSRWSPRMAPYIWGSRNKIHLIDISKTAFLLEKSGKFLKEEASNGRMFLWVGTKKAARKVMLEVSKNTKMPFVINRWIGGTLSNHDQVKKAVTRLLHLRDVVSRPTTHYKKKEIVMISKEIERLEKNVGGIIGLGYPPAAVVVVDAKKENAAVREAFKLGIPVISIVDTNTDPEGVNFVIPANDDSPKSISFIIKYLEEQIQEGVTLFQEKKKEEIAEKKKKSSSGSVPHRADVKTVKKPAVEVPKKEASEKEKTDILKKESTVELKPIKKEVEEDKKAKISVSLDAKSKEEVSEAAPKTKPKTDAKEIVDSPKKSVVKKVVSKSSSIDANDKKSAAAPEGSVARKVKTATKSSSIKTKK